MKKGELIEKTPEAKEAHKEFLRRCAKDLDLIEKCYEEIKAGLVNPYCPSIKAVLALAIPIIQKAERERLSEIYIRYNDTIAPKDIRQLMLDGKVLEDWQARKGEV